MIGRVDQGGRALIKVRILTESSPTGAEVDAWIDTGFTGDLVFPKVLIDQLGMRKSGSIDAILADGAEVELETYKCRLVWFGRERPLQVIANQGEVPLLGVGLLLGRELRIDYTNLTLTLLPSERIEG